MIIEHFLIANNSSIDHERNSLSIFDIVEDINIRATAPNVVIPIQVIAVIKRDIADVGQLNMPFTLEISSAANNPVNRQEFSVVMDAPHRRSRIRINVAFPVPKTADFRFRLFRTDQPSVARETDIHVAITIEAPPQQRPQTPPWHKN